MISCLMVGIGGFFGSILRYLISLIPMGEQNSFPYKTLITNIIGAFLIGVIVALSLKNAKIDEKYILLLKTGFCGGFTTFSTFALETTGLVQDGKYSLAFLYAIISVVACVCATFLAEIIVKA